jgi:uncharacterized protein YecE (DUF72 family)
MSRVQYFTKLSFLESTALATATPSLKALRKWRSERPADSALSLVVAHSIDLAYLRDALEATGAEVVVFRTPADFSPSATNRSLIASLLGDRATSLASARVWDPHGLWEPASAAVVARDTGALLVLDPLATDPLGEQLEVLAEALASGVAYLRASGIGSGRRRFRETDLDDLGAQLMELERGWVAFANPDKLRDARALVARLQK